MGFLKFIEGLPLRPIVSFVDSPTYELFKYLSDILSPLVGNSNCCIRNAQDWADTAKTIQIENDEELVSFEVASLFTSIPADVAVQVARERLMGDTRLSERTLLNPGYTRLSELLSFCLSST